MEPTDEELRLIEAVEAERDSDASPALFSLECRYNPVTEEWLFSAGFHEILAGGHGGTLMQSLGRALSRVDMNDVTVKALRRFAAEQGGDLPRVVDLAMEAAEPAIGPSAVLPYMNYLNSGRLQVKNDDPEE